VGIPGILMALWVRTLREPVRGISEGIVTEDHPAPFSVLAKEMSAMLPIFNLMPLKRDGGSLAVNGIAALVIALVSWGLMIVTDNIPQWIAIGTGVYIVFSWAQSLKARQRATVTSSCSMPKKKRPVVGYITITSIPSLSMSASRA